MGKDRIGKREKSTDDRDETVGREEEEEENKVYGDKKHAKSKRKMEHASYSGSESGGRESNESEEERRRSRSNRRRSSSRRKSRGRYSDEESDSYSGSSSYESDSDTDESETEEERRRRKRKERKKREEREKDKDRKRRRKGRERKSGRDGEEDERRRKKKKEKEKEKEKKMKQDKGKKGAVTNSWGKYGTIREIDMWNKRPEFTAWLAEVKEVNLESLPNWEEKKMFKEYMEDYNTATLPSKKYYNLDYYHKKKMQKQMKKGLKQVGKTERTIFNDEEQRRLELMREREKHKLKEVEALKNAMQAGMAQDMKEQARLKEEMQYLYKVGNYEAAAVIQRKLDPDVAM